MTKNDNIGIILLAAGASSRFHQNKLTLVIENDTLIEKTLKAAANSEASEILVVTGAYQEIKDKISSKDRINIVENINWEKGIGSSIKCGLQNMLNENPFLNAVIISVCDQPFLSSEIIDGLINTYKKTKKMIIASAYVDSIGVPVLYDKRLFGDLLNIPDKQGAKKYVIEKVAEDNIATFPFPKGEIDIDTIEDLGNLFPDLHVRDIEI